MRLNRDQLGAFLKDPRAIREFERLFVTVDDMAASDAGDFAANAASSLAQEALSVAMADRFGLAPRTEPVALPDDLAPRHEPREAIAALTDVMLTGLANGQVLAYRDGKWVNSAALWRQSRAITASDTVLITDYLILCDATGGAITVTLPAAASAGRVLNVKKTDVSANAVTIDGSGAETIDGAATFVLPTQYDNVTVQSDGATWWIT